MFRTGYGSFQTVANIILAQGVHNAHFFQNTAGSCRRVSQNHMKIIGFPMG